MTRSSAHNVQNLGLDCAVVTMTFAECIVGANSPQKIGRPCLRGADVWSGPGIARHTSPKGQRIFT